ncbi:MAG: filamentous hemagglutinin N-terminal domain-containing protein, partial [Verrucomicrobiota bacterium]
MKLSKRIAFSARVSLTFYFSMAAVAKANPTDGVVAAGGASMATAGSALNITTATDKTIINWGSFSIGSGQVTNFIQPGASSAVLNRVIGSMPSEIAGQLLSNGRVALLNSNGIFITQSGSINTNGFTASTLNLSDAQFMGNGGLTFKGDSEAVVSNAGTILARQGDVFLIGKTVNNSGHIEALNGNVALAAGSDITLQKAGDGRMSVTIAGSSKKGTVTHSGTIKAVQQQLRDNGGNPYVLGMNVDHSAEMTPADFANAQVIIDAGAGKAEVSGSIQAGTQAAGGAIQVSGASVTLRSGANLDVSGDFKGGTIQVGGGFQGKDTSVANSQFSSVELGATLSADARLSGNGGNVVVWADQATGFQGSISAKGGSLSGDGGFVEVSGKQWLSFQGTVSTLAPNGKVGTLLLDPSDITISTDPDSDISVPPTFTFTGTGPGNISNLNVTTLLNALSGGNVEVTTVGSPGANSGDITVNNAISWNNGSKLTLTASNQIQVNAVISNTGGGDLVLSGLGVGVAFNANVSLSGGLPGTSNLSVSSISTIGADITTTGTQTYTGAVTLSGGNRILTGTTIQNVSTLAGGGNGLAIIGNALVDGAITGVSNLSVSGTSGLGADVTTTGTQVYTGGVTLSGGDRVLSGLSVRNLSTLMGGSNGLTITGNAIVDGAMTGLTSLSVSGTSAIGADITTTATQVYTGVVTLGGGIRTLSGSTPTFTAGILGAGNDLSLDFSGVTSLDGALFTGIGNLATGNGGLTQITGSLTTTGTQTYNGA